MVDDNGLTLTFDPEKIEGLVERAILQEISPEERERIIAQAVRRLIEPSVRSAFLPGGKTISLLQQAFELTIQRMARQVVDDHLRENVEVQQRLKLAINKVVVAALADDEGFTNIVGAAISGGITSLLADRRWD